MPEALHYNASWIIGGSCCKDDTIRHSEGKARRISFNKRSFAIAQDDTNRHCEELATKQSIARGQALPSAMTCDWQDTQKTVIAHSVARSFSLDCFANTHNDSNGHSESGTRRILLNKKFFGFHPQNDIAKKAAFTLAEVLITLGIIGIVAAMTLPTVINNTQHKELETAFKKSYANLANAVNLVNADGVPVYVLNPTEDRPDGDPDANSAYAQAVYSKYKQLKKLSITQKREYNNAILNYSRKRPGQIPACSQAISSENAFVAMDGSLLSITQNCSALWFTIDTNGLKKPNALGHDIFIFRISKDSTNNALKPAYAEPELKLDDDGNLATDENGNHIYNTSEDVKDKCSPTSASAINGSACANFAILDRCPGDESKGYFECLP